MTTPTPSRDDLHRLIDELPQEALRSAADFLEDVVEVAEDAAAAKKALADPERIPYEDARRELGLEG